MKHKVPVILAVSGAVFLLLYVIFAAKPVSDGLAIIPEWTVPLLETPAENSAAENPVPFKVNGLYGYVSESGKVLYKKSYSYRAAVSESYCADYDAAAADTVVYSPAGEQVCTLEAGGFPFFQDNRLYLFLPGGTSVAEYGSDGQRKWVYENYAPITAFNSSANGVVIGYADGNLAGLYPDGEKRFSFYPGGSEYQVIYGAAVSPAGEYSVMVSGLDRQRVLLARYTNGQNKVVFHEYLEGAVTSQTFVGFSEAGDFAYFNDAKGLGVLDCKKLAVVHIPMQGKILAVEELPENLLAVLSREGKIHRVSFIEDGSHLIGSFAFPAESSSILRRDKSLYVSRDAAVSKISLIRR